jgi:hypothetical protein
MSDWSTNHKIKYFLYGLSIVFVVFLYPTLTILFPKPTCTDGKKNQDEEQVDCGGVCINLCQNLYEQPRILWSRFMEVQPDIYNLVAYIRNQNDTAEGYNAPYSFKLYDEFGNVVASRSGTTYIPAGKNYAIFEGGVVVPEEDRPVRMVFEFTEPVYFVSPQYSQPELSWKVERGEVRGGPLLTVTFKNSTINAVEDIAAFAFLYDAEDNVVAFSRTIIDRIEAQGEYQATYTWLKPFATSTPRVEIVPIRIPR